MFGIAGLLDLVVPLLGEANAEHTQQIAICGLHINMGFNQGLQWNAQSISNMTAFRWNEQSVSKLLSHQCAFLME